jgi:two-component system, OmpR family, aerobic respiration control sensor histidine kinase ArcB
LIFRDVVEFIFSFALFINALLFLPQAYKIKKEKTAKSVSLITFLGFFAIQIAIVLHGIMVHDAILVIGYLFAILTTGLVVGLIIYYRFSSQATSSPRSLTVEEVINQLPGHIYWKDMDCTFVGSNANNHSDFGVDKISDFIGKNDYDLFSKDEADKIRALDKKILETRKPRVVEELLTTASGKKALYLSQKKPLVDSDGNIIGLLGCSIDITESKQKVLDNLSVLENVIAVMPGNVYWMNKEGFYLGCNDNEAKAVGLKSRKDIVGKRNTDIEGFVIPEALDPINERVFSGETVVVEEPAVLPDGSKIIMLSSKVPIRNSDKDIIGMVGISVDITDTKNLKLERERSEAMRMLAGSIVHQLNTPLSAIQLFANQVLHGLGEIMKLDGFSDNNQHIEEMSRAIEKQKQSIHAAKYTMKVIQNNIKHAKIEDVSLKKYSMKATVEKFIDIYPLTDKQRTVIECRLDRDFEFMADQDLFLDVLANLMSNAISHLNIASDKVSISLIPGKLHNELVFEDTGSGIEPDILPHIFERFYTKTKNGSGIGLAFCRQVMLALGGSITCESDEGEFTRFILRFPLIRG